MRKIKVKNQKIYDSEFREDIVSGDWILMAPKRGKRPGAGGLNKNQRKISSPASCPFENPASPAVLEFPSLNGKDWFVKIISNKYPALKPHKICPVEKAINHYSALAGVGWHEVIITRDHRKTIAEYSTKEVEVLIEAYQRRYLELSKDPCVKYILIFHNFGEKAGATIAHPHSQLMALPIIPPDVARSLAGSKNFFQKNKKCVHCVIVDFEKKEKIRVVYENKNFLAVSPFASRASFEARIYPKRHGSHFELMSLKERLGLAEALRFVLKKFKNNLGDPDYNFFIHTAPAKPGDFNYYHWHMEILPRMTQWAGVELGTGIEIVAVAPEEAAKILRA